MRRRIAAVLVTAMLTFGTTAVTAGPVAAQETTTQDDGGDSGLWGLAGLLGLLGLAGLRKRDDRGGYGGGGGTRP